MTKDTAAVAAIDLSVFMPFDAAVLEVLNPATGSKIGWSITFAGPGHAKTEAWSNEKAREALHRARQIEAAQVNGKKFKPEERTVDEERRESVRWVVSRILDWTPVKLAAGEEAIAFSEDAAVKLFMNPKLAWVYNQCLEFLNSDQSFTTASAKR